MSKNRGKRGKSQPSEEGEYTRRVRNWIKYRAGWKKNKHVQEALSEPVVETFMEDDLAKADDIHVPWKPIVSELPFPQPGKRVREILPNYGDEDVNYKEMMHSLGSMI